MAEVVEFEREILKAILDIHEVLQVLSQTLTEINATEDRIGEAIEILADKMGYSFEIKEDAKA